MKDKKNVTTSEIARVLNVSRGTVSRALNDHPLVSDETRELVWQTARDLGFRPNRAARSLVLNQQYRIAVLVYSQPTYFWNEVRQGVAKAEQVLGDYGVSVSFHEPEIDHPEYQQEMMKRLVADGVHGIAVSPNTPEALTDTINEATEQGVPVVTVSSDVPESQRLCYVGCDYYQAGRIAGHVMGRWVWGPGKVAVLTFTDAVMTIRQRITGFREVLSSFSHLDILGPYRLSRTGEEVYDFTRSLLAEHGTDLTGIFVSYGVLEAVGQAVADSGHGARITVVGYDLSSEIAELIRRDVVDATICQEPFNQGYYPVDILYRYLAEGKKPYRSIVNTKLEIVSRENIRYYERESDYYKFLLDL